MERDGFVVTPLDDMITDVLYSSFRLYSKGRVLGHKRGKRNSRPNTSLIQIEGVANKEDAQFYLGKVYFHRALWVPNYHALIFSGLRMYTGRRRRYMEQKFG